MKFMLATEKQNSSICAPDSYNRKIVMKTQGHPVGSPQMLLGNGMRAVELFLSTPPSELIDEAASTMRCGFCLESCRSVN